MYLFACFVNDQFIIGDGNNLYDFTYVENVAHAHICAERALASGGDVSEKASGQVHLIFSIFCIFLVKRSFINWLSLNQLNLLLIKIHLDLV